MKLEVGWPDSRAECGPRIGLAAASAKTSGRAARSGPARWRSAGRPWQWYLKRWVGFPTRWVGLAGARLPSATPMMLARRPTSSPRPAAVFLTLMCVVRVTVAIDDGDGSVDVDAAGDGSGGSPSLPGTCGPPAAQSFLRGPAPFL